MRGPGFHRIGDPGIAHNAALKLCAILLHAEGYKAKRNLQHYRTIQALPKILGSEK